MTRHKYYVISYETCPKCGGTKQDPDLDGSDLVAFMFACRNCNEHGEVRVEVPLTKALAELQVKGMLPTIGG